MVLDLPSSAISALFKPTSFINGTANELKTSSAYTNPKKVKKSKYLFVEIVKFLEVNYLEQTVFDLRF